MCRDTATAEDSTCHTTVWPVYCGTSILGKPAVSIVRVEEFEITRIINDFIFKSVSGQVTFRKADFPTSVEFHWIFVHSIPFDMFRWKVWEGYSFKSAHISVVQPLVTKSRTDNLPIYNCHLDCFSFRCSREPKFRFLKAACGKNWSCGSWNLAETSLAARPVCQNGEVSSRVSKASVSKWRGEFASQPVSVFQSQTKFI